MNGDWNESKEEENDISQGAFPIRRHGYGHQLTCDDMNFVSNADENKCRSQEVKDRIIWNEDEYAVCIGRQPNVILSWNNNYNNFDKEKTYFTKTNR